MLPRRLHAPYAMSCRFPPFLKVARSRAVHKNSANAPEYLLDCGSFEDNLRHILTSPTNAWRTWFRRHSSKKSRTSTSRHFRPRLLSLANGQSGTSTRQCQRLLWGNGLCCGWVYNDELWGQSPCKRYVWHWHILQRIKVCYIFCISFISMSRRKWYIEGIFNKAKSNLRKSWI